MIAIMMAAAIAAQQFGLKCVETTHYFPLAPGGTTQAPTTDTETYAIDLEKLIYVVHHGEGGGVTKPGPIAGATASEIIFRNQATDDFKVNRLTGDLAHTIIFPGIAKLVINGTCEKTAYIDIPAAKF